MAYEPVKDAVGNTVLKMDKTEQTLEYYQKNAEAFCGATVSADMQDARARFLQCLPEKAHILDQGCGSGRDTREFLMEGYTVDAVDGSEELCKRAATYTGIPVKKMLFSELSEINRYDGVWACASILHLEKTELSDVLIKVSGALKENGILYASFKYGTFEGLRNGRYFTDFTEDTLAEFMTGVGSLTVFDQWITGDVRSGREEERWINILARRVWR